MADDLQTKVNYAEFVRNFAKYRTVSAKEPVFISSYGRPTHVLIDIDQFEKARSGTGELGDEVYSEVLREFSAMSVDAMIVCDNDAITQHANAVAASMLRSSRSAMVGKHLSQVLPNFGNSLVEANVRQTLGLNEVTSADLPSPTREGGWVHFRSYPWHSVNLLVFRDITEQVRAHRFADVKLAILQGMEVHGGTYYVRLGSTGLISRADKPFCDLVGISEERMIGAQFSDLAAPSAKVELRSLVQEILGGREFATFRCEFVDNKGKVHALRGAMIALHGAYVFEGAIALLTSDQ